MKPVRVSLPFFLLLLSFSIPLTAAIQAIEVKTYDQLVHAIRAARAASQQRIETAVQQEKVREAWEIGKLIDEHVLQHKERADYGKHVILKLAKDLGTSETELRFMLQFARAYPIHWPADELSWSHYQSLLALNDPKEREEVTKQAVREHWNRNQVREEVRRRQVRSGAASVGAGLAPAPGLTATPGKIGTYRVIQAKAGEFKGELLIDLGFSNYYLPQKKLKFQDRDIVESVGAGLAPAHGRPQGPPLRKLKGGTQDDLFTYAADIIEVIDGDTLKVIIHLGFGFVTVQKLRLRGLDAPEIESAEGKEAKTFLEKALGFSVIPAPAGGWSASGGKAIPGIQNPKVIIRTSRSDKYDRYLADVFIPSPSLRGAKRRSNLGLEDYVYLNQALIDHGLAVRVNE